jgi:O-antigen/teichoic acid export membrane protein
LKLGEKMFRGLAWSSMERLSIQAIQFILGIILARILTEEQYGTVGILLIFIAISKVFIDSGFSQALIQKKNHNLQDENTVFIFNLLLSIICYVILYLGAPYFAEFYSDNPIHIELPRYLRIIAIILIINAFGAVPLTLVTKELNFKVQTIINAIASILSGVVAVYLAYDGYGVMALIYQQIVRALIALVAIYALIKWRPLWIFSWHSFKDLFRYGSNILIGSVLGVLVNNLSAVFIPKMLSVSQFGYYTRGMQFSDFAFGVVNSTLGRVIFPGLSRVQDDLSRLVGHTRQIIKLVAILNVPLFMFLAVLAKPIIVVLLTERWLPAAPVMQFFCLARMVTIISGVNVSLMQAIGRTDLILRQQYVKIAVRIGLLVFAFQYGIVYVALAELISTSIHFFINTYHPGKIMKYGALKQLWDLKEIFTVGIFASGITYFTNMFLSLHWFQQNLGEIIGGVVYLLICFLIGGIFYLLLCRLLKIREFKTIINQLKSLINNR